MIKTKNSRYIYNNLIPKIRVIGANSCSLNLNFFGTVIPGVKRPFQHDKEQDRSGYAAGDVHDRLAVERCETAEKQRQHRGERYRENFAEKRKKSSRTDLAERNQHIHADVLHRQHDYAGGIHAHTADRDFRNFGVFGKDPHEILRQKLRNRRHRHSETEHYNHRVAHGGFDARAVSRTVIKTHNRLTSHRQSAHRHENQLHITDDDRRRRNVDVALCAAGFLQDGIKYYRQHAVGGDNNKRRKPEFHDARHDFP